MVFIGDVQNRALSKKIAKRIGANVIYPDIFVFPDGERRVRITENVVDKNIVILKSLGPPVDNNILELCFIIDVLKRNGAGEIFGIVPYLGYSRADHMFRTGEGVPLEVVIKMIEGAGLDSILIIDPHSIRIPELFKIKVVNDSALHIFAEKIEKMNTDKRKMVVVSPDMGGIRRTKILAEMLKSPYSVVNKDRDYETGELDRFEVREGSIKEMCIIIDDMISSGKTIIGAANELSRKGAKKIYAFATHPIFSADAHSLLENSKIDKIFVTDSIFIPEERVLKKLEILSIEELISDRIKSWSKD